MRVAGWCCLTRRAVALVLLGLMPLPSSAVDPWDPAYGYVVAPRQSSGVTASESPYFTQGARDPYAAGGAPNGLPSGAKPPSLYETLRSDPGLGRAPSGRIEGPTSPPGPDPGRYRFRGDGPAVEGGEPASASDYRYRPLTAQERDRGQVTSGWRPVTLPRQESPAPLNPARTSSQADRRTGGWTQGQPPYPELPGRPNHEAENWFDRHYGEGRR